MQVAGIVDCQLTPMPSENQVHIWYFYSYAGFDSKAFYIGGTNFERMRIPGDDLSRVPGPIKWVPR